MPVLEFKGKQHIYAHHLTVPYRPLLPDPARSCRSAGADDNLIVHGDNLHALKALLPRYAGRIKCIYIDPPYNTGNEGWSYNDNVNSPLMKEWLRTNGPVDNEDLERHDKWLCMMWPRLHLLRDLLSEDGVIFVSIDDNEVHHLRSLMDEVFGESNFVAMFVRKRRLATGMRDNQVSQDHEFVACYARQSGEVSFAGAKRKITDYPLEDSAGRYRSTDLTIGMDRNLRPNQFYEIVDPRTGTGYWPPEQRVWRFEPSTMKREIEAGNIIWPAPRQRRMTRPRYKTRYDPNDPRKTNPISTWIDTRNSDVENDAVFDLTAALNTTATQELRAIFDHNQVFSYPKPVSLVKELVRAATDRDSIVFDSFAGSGTTAHAVLALNKEDGGNRRFILVECEDYADSVTAERVRRVIEGVPGARDATLREGLGGSFIFATLGDPIELEGMLSGEALPPWSDLAAYLLHTASGVSAGAGDLAPRNDDGLFHSSDKLNYHLLYQPDLKFLCSNDAVLNEERAKRISAAARGQNRKAVVFAAAKYIGQRELSAWGITFCQLPYELSSRVE